MGLSQSSVAKNTGIEEIRVFECLHGYHKRCIDTMQDYNKQPLVDQEVTDDFFQMKRGDD